MSLKIAHISDIHLGAKLSYLENEADEHRSDIKNSFKNSVDKAIENSVDLFIISGDLFDNPFPSKLNQIFALDQIKKLNEKNIYVLLISGNHDRTEGGSVFDKSILTEYSSPKYKLVNKEVQTEWQIPELTTIIQASGTQHQKNKNTPYTKLIRNNEFKFNIGVFHGSADIKGAPENNPIYLKDLYESKFDYFALGDWHNLLDLSKATTVFYSGSPELIDSDQEKSGYMLVIELKENEKPVVNQIKVGLRNSKSLKLDISQTNKIEGVVSSIKSYTDKNMFLNLYLTGFKSIDNEFDIAMLNSLLAEYFYYVKIYDQTKLQLSEKDLLTYPENMIIGKYIKLLQNKKENEEKGEIDDTVVDEALQLGVHLLKGGKL
jgi:DNA repair exonuclease SbcCD nuclease subunit